MSPEEVAARLREAGIDAGAGEHVTIKTPTAIDLLDMTLAKSGTEEAASIVRWVAALDEPLHDENSSCVLCYADRLNGAPHDWECAWLRAQEWVQEWGSG